MSIIKKFKESITNVDTSVTFTDHTQCDEEIKIDSRKSFANAIFVKITKKLYNFFDMADLMVFAAKENIEVFMTFVTLFAEFICLIGSIITRKNGNKKASNKWFAGSILSYLACLFFADKANDTVDFNELANKRKG